MNSHGRKASLQHSLVFMLGIILMAACTTQGTPVAPSPTTQALPSATLAATLGPTNPPPTLPLPTETQAFPAVSPTPSQQATTEVPLATPTVGVASFSIVMVNEGENLTVRQAAGEGSAAISSLPYDATGIQMTGNEITVQNDRWVEIRLPSGGTGWINGVYLTESIPAGQFCADPQVQTLLDQFSQAMLNKDGKLLSSLLSPRHGFSLQFYRDGIIANYSQEEAEWVFTSTYEMPWGTHPGSGMPVKGTFTDVVLPKIQDALTHNPNRLCNQIGTGGTTYNPAWPEIYKNINYYSINRPGTPGTELDWQTLVIGIEYVSGKPYLFSMLHYEWEP